MTSTAAVCRDAIAQGSKSFAMASLLLGPGQRDHVSALYAWCRRADDAVDLAPPDEQAAALEVLQRELSSVYAGDGQTDPVLAAFQATVRCYGIPIEYPSELLRGMHMDATGYRYSTLQELLLYCYRVAGTVGAMMCHVLGVSHPAALRNAVHMGMAMQLTNISRDVAEDWERGRVYVPRALLGETEAAPPSRGELARIAPSARPALRTLLDEARKYYRSGDRGIVHLPLRAALAVRAARLIYASIGTIVALRGYDPLAGRAVVPFVVKVLLVLWAICCTAVELPSRLRRGAGRAELTRSIRYPADVLPV